MPYPLVYKRSQAGRRKELLKYPRDYVGRHCMLCYSVENKKSKKGNFLGL
jgi:hypothetical protein